MPSSASVHKISAFWITCDVIGARKPTCKCDVTVGLASRVLGYALVVAKVIAVNPGDVELHAHLYETWKGSLSDDQAHNLLGIGG